MELAPKYPVLTERLALRPLGTTDAEALLSYRSLPEVCRYVPFEPMTAADIAAKIETIWARHTLDDEGQSLNLGVELRDTGELVGDVMLAWHSCEHRGGEIGYVFHPDHGGRGYATESMHAVLHLAFDELDLHRLIARIDARNELSGRVCERLGMRAEAHLIRNEWFKGEWTDEIDYGLLSEEWQRRTPVPGCDRCGA